MANANNQSNAIATISFTLDPQQLSVQNHVIRLVNERNAHYNSYSAAEGHDYSSDSDSGMSVEEHELHNEFNIDRNQQQSYATNNCWTKPILLTGKPGAGKTYTILWTVNELVPMNTKILVAAPTGFLASVYRYLVDDEVTCDTVHAAFHIPVESDQSPSINWDISCYDLVIIDKVSMISEPIFNHILKTFNYLVFRPVLLLPGDPAQQQPFTCANGRIMQLTSPLDNLLQRLTIIIYKVNTE